jgi:NTP pyrophosphatase (non-canonical NTP hydrolase)
MPHLKENPTLHELQHYQHELCKERGWDKSTDLETFLLFTEEVGELAKAIRNRRKLYVEEGKKAKHNELEYEMADVLGYLLELANQMGVDLNEAFRQKEEANAKRNWGDKVG